MCCSGPRRAAGEQMLRRRRKPAHTAWPVSRRDCCIIAHPTRTCWRALPLRALNPRPPQPGPQALNTSCQYPQCHYIFRLTGCLFPSAAYRNRRLTSAIHPQRSAESTSTNRPRHRPIRGPSCDRPTRRAPQPIASKQLRTRCAEPPKTEHDHTRVAPFYTLLHGLDIPFHAP